MVSVIIWQKNFLFFQVLRAGITKCNNLPSEKKEKAQQHQYWLLYIGSQFVLGSSLQFCSLCLSLIVLHAVGRWHHHTCLHFIISQSRQHIEVHKPIVFGHSQIQAQWQRWRTSSTAGPFWSWSESLKCKKGRWYQAVLLCLFPFIFQLYFSSSWT